MSTPTYPDIEVELIGTDGNAFALIGKVSTALKQAKISREQVVEFQRNAMQSPSYEDLLNYLMETVSIS